jgi:hypothetical protein
VLVKAPVIAGIAAFTNGLRVDVTAGVNDVAAGVNAVAALVAAGSVDAAVPAAVEVTPAGVNKPLVPPTDVFSWAI